MQACMFVPLACRAATTRSILCKDNKAPNEELKSNFRLFTNSGTGASQIYIHLYGGDKVVGLRGPRPAFYTLRSYS